MGRAIVQRLAANWLALTLSAVAGVLIVLLFRTDRELELYKSASHRYRMHAIPVAVSQLYRGQAHDYTSHRKMAHRFQNTNADLDKMIEDMMKAPPPDDTEPYFWTADDRGLSDYVNGAFQLYGPRVKSLTKFYFLLLGGTVTLFFLGYWRTPVVLAGPVLALFGLVALAQVLKIQTEIPLAGVTWTEDIALYESRLFEVLGLISCLHLALLAAGGPRPRWEAWLTAVPQAAFLLFLLHARSTLGWQYLALFVLISGRVAVTLWGRWRSADRPPLSRLAGALFVAAALVASLIGLKQYKQAMYNPEYFRESGSRTFWHNALMGYYFHPRLEKELGLPGVDDGVVVDLVLKRMRAVNDPRLDATWERQTILNSLGNHGKFDWPTYEAVCKEIYLGVWRDQPSTAATCYAWYKPQNIAKQSYYVVRLQSREASGGRSRVLVPAALLAVFTLVCVFAAGRRDQEVRDHVRALSWIGCLVTTFALIPGMAFYPTTTTLACFYISLPITAGLLAVRVGWRLTRPRAVASVPVPAPVTTKLAA